MNKVYIVGAGCGDINLYTLKALSCIKQADCVIYDDLIDPPILDYCKETCEKIYVGKRMHKTSIKQNEILDIIFEKSKQYEIVVRLKGGDPYVFGRGGEEGQFLYEHNVLFEVVPGISSAVGGLAYAGIPVTHRAMSRGFQVYTGHFENDQQESLNFENMLSNQYTYIFLMSINRLSMIVEGLLSAGKNKETPVCIISHASLASQQCLVSTLEHVVEDYQNNPLPTPGIIVVGDVVKMREYLDFQSHKPLFKKRILLASTTRDPEFVGNLEFLGAEVTQVITGEIKYQDVDLPVLDGYLIFTSKHGVIGFMKNYLKQYKDIRKLSNVKIICVGTKTNEVLNEYGLNADYIPSVFNGETLNKEFKEMVKGKNVYLMKGNYPSTVKIQTESFEVYQNIEKEIIKRDETYDYGLFTSPSSFKRYYEVCGDLCDTYVSIGTHTTHIIKNSINKNIIEANPSTKEGMIEALLKE